MNEKMRKRNTETCFLPGLGPDNAGKSLAEAVQSRELDRWEAFPVLLASTAEAGEFSLEAANASLNEEEKPVLRALIFVSLGLYHHLGREFAWTKDLSGDFAPRLTANFSDRIRLNTEIELAGLRLVPERVKAYFQKNFRPPKVPVKTLAETGEKLVLELAVSRIFTQRQKDLFLKRLRRKKMTKTEKEYFSRVIKKKLQALANEELHSLAKKVLE